MYLVRSTNGKMWVYEIDSEEVVWKHRPSSRRLDDYVAVRERRKPRAWEFRDGGQAAVHYSVGQAMALFNEAFGD